MINIRELRIGNFIENSGEIVEVGVDLFKAIEQEPNKFSGIKINDDWLKKFNIPIEEKEGFEYWFDSKGSWLVEVVQEGSTENNYIAQCFFVHQLQNIYFALTGEEIDEEE